MAPAGWHSTTLTGLAAKIYGTALIISMLSSVVLVLRLIARLKMSQFSLEDWLMCTGWEKSPYALFIHSCSHCYAVSAEADAYS